MAFDFARFHALTLGGEPLEDLIESFPGIKRDPHPSELRIVSFSPNEDSPLEDKVVLRGDAHQLSVSAGVHSLGAFEVYRVVDGTLIAIGEDPEPVPLQPGAHDAGRVYVVSTDGSITSEKLPRVVKGAESSATTSISIGITAHLDSLGSDQLYATFSEIEAALDLIAKEGFQSVRFGIPWASLEPNGKGQFDEAALGRFEALIDAVTVRGLEPLPLINGTPGWASSGPVNSEDGLDWFLAPPRESEDFGEAVGLMVTRWPQIHYWQILNEPSLEFFYRGGSVETFVRDTAAAVIHGLYASAEAQFVSAGLANTDAVVPDLGYLQSILSQGIGDYVDALAIHPLHASLERWAAHAPHLHRRRSHLTCERRAFCKAALVDRVRLVHGVDRRDGRGAGGLAGR